MTGQRAYDRLKGRRQNTEKLVFAGIVANGETMAAIASDPASSPTDSNLDNSLNAALYSKPTDARHWGQILARYREPSHARSIVEIAITFGASVIGVLTSTPSGFWRKAHAAHHASSGNLDQRGLGAISTLTVREYLAPSW